MNKKTFMIALCMVGHGGYAVESNANMNPQPYVRLMMERLRSDVDWMHNTGMSMAFPWPNNPNADQWAAILDKVVVSMAPVKARWEHFQNNPSLYPQQNPSDLEKLENSFKSAQKNLWDMWSFRNKLVMDTLPPQEEDQYKTQQTQKAGQLLEHYRKYYQEKKDSGAHNLPFGHKHPEPEQFSFGHPQPQQNPTESLRTAINNNSVAEWLNSEDARSLWRYLNFARLYPEKTGQVGDLKTHLHSVLAYEPYAEDEQLLNQLITIVDEQYGPDLRNLPQNKINTATLDKAREAAQWIDNDGGGKLIFYAWTPNMQNDLMQKKQDLAVNVEGLDVPISESEAFFDLIDQRKLNGLHATVNGIEVPTDPVLRESLLKIIQLKHGKNLDLDLPHNQIDGEQATRANQYQKALRDLMGHVECP